MLTTLLLQVVHLAVAQVAAAAVLAATLRVQRWLQVLPTQLQSVVVVELSQAEEVFLVQTLPLCLKPQLAGEQAVQQVAVIMAQL
jgi:hypothetical protein